MVNQLPLSMDMLKYRLRGYTLLEMILVVWIMAMVSTFTLTIRIPSSSEFTLFEHQYLNAQIQALAKKKSIFLKTPQSNVARLSFNANGNVNQAQTIQINKTKFIVQLGMGRYVVVF